MITFPEDLQTVYRYFRQAWGPFAQGPAAIIARHADETVFSVDALGLRPLWFGETEKDFYFSSEKGVFHLDSLCCDPKPLSPGEKMSVRLHRRSNVEVLDYAAIQKRVLKLAQTRFGSLEKLAESLRPPEPPIWKIGVVAPLQRDDDETLTLPLVTAATATFELEKKLAAFGWSKEDEEWVRALADTGNEPIGSLGYDGPLAALAPEWQPGAAGQNVADYFKEAVAVVTNPAIDREREMEHFSTQCVIGPRPEIALAQSGPGQASDKTRGLRFVLDSPVIMGGDDRPMLPESLGFDVAVEVGSYSLERMLAAFPAGSVCHLVAGTEPGESVQAAVMRLARTAVDAVYGGAELVLLDDAGAFTEGRGWLDPHVALAAVDAALRAAQTAAADPAESALAGSNGHNGGRATPRPPATVQRTSLRRRTGLVLRSGALRNLHDLALALGLGADGVVPYSLVEVAVNDPLREKPLTERAARVANVMNALRAGLEKVTSTMGIHELRGYGRIFSSIGLSSPVADVMGAVNYAGSETRGLTWAALDADAAARMAVATGMADGRMSRPYHIYPKVWKAAGQVALGETPGPVYEERVEALGREQPVTLRHILGFRFPDLGDAEMDAGRVDAGLTGHDLPFLISSMSFGSQGEVAFRAYAEAAFRANMIALNGEGGEIPDLMGKYPHNRGQQIASGRFGVDINLVNSSNLLEIKIGQGAKPGEGGHLPGKKVSKKVAQARHARPGVDLISPSNNHDIYSIEDLAQFIEELKTANPKARVAVKVPVVPGIGIISVGIAKAGADIINLTGFDGGTGAARKHSLRHVGLPAEIGVVEAHRALTESGLRSRVELWCDGGMRTAADVVKMTCLGANRVGFGTLAMVAIGCTICRACQTDTCHVGIATQIESREQAESHGLRRFEPRDHELAVQGLVRFFCSLGDGVRVLTARLGFERTQDLVGRSDLLEQVTHFDRLDLSDLLRPVSDVSEEQRAHSLTVTMSQRPLRRPRNSLTTVISNLVMEAALSGEEVISFEDDKVSPVDRALGTHLSGALTRYRQQWIWPPGHGGVGGSLETWRAPARGANGDGRHVREATLRLYASSVPGNGLGAYSSHPVNITVEGGAQDSVAKGMHGGRLVVLRGYNHNGRPVDGSVGKSLAYGALGGLIIVQGDADSRACIRLSGADVILGGLIQQPLDDSLGFLGARANVKGFLCEYMTAGRVLVMGDPGPWICAGMTGGLLYLRLQPEMGFDREAIRRRVARGAKVEIRSVDNRDEANLRELLTAYADELLRGHQQIEADKVLDLLRDWRRAFVKIEPAGQIVDQSINTE